MGIRRLAFLLLIFPVVFLGARCAAIQQELHSPEEMASQGVTHADMPMMTIHAKDYVYPLTQINLQTVIEENQGLRIPKENATMVHDYYRGGVQEKAEAERLMKEEQWEEAEVHFQQSNWFLKVVIDYFPDDEPSKNIYGDHTIIFLPNLLIADNSLKRMEIYCKTKRNEDIYWARREGKAFLSRSFGSAKTEWGYRLKKALNERFKKEEALGN